MNNPRIRQILSFVIVSCLVTLSACSEQVVLIDEGDLCFLSENGDQPIEADSKLRVQVAVPECLSQSCDVDREAECTAELVDDTITIKSELRYRFNGKNACTLDCGRLYAECFIENIPAGTYSIVHGESNYELEIPNTESSVCYSDFTEPFYR